MWASFGHAYHVYIQTLINGFWDPPVPRNSGFPPNFTKSHLFSQILANILISIYFHLLQPATQPAGQAASERTSQQAILIASDPHPRPQLSYPSGILRDLTF